MNLPANFRKLSVEKRKEILGLAADPLDSKADLLIESCIGTYPVPLGLATGFLIDGKQISIPMATEEASVIAAASHAASLVKAGGGFNTSAQDSILSAQVFLLGTRDKQAILTAIPTLQQLVDEEIIPNIVKRRGGFRGLEVEEIDQGLLVTIDLDVCDAMGANIANTVVEALKTRLVSLAGGEVLMAIVSNSAEKRLATASFKIPARHFRKEGFTSEEICNRICLANEIAKSCPKRAVTHNKGVMNGISALTLATGNDTRAIEAGAHFFASNGPLTHYSFEEGHLIGEIKLPLALGTVGGSITSWPGSRKSLEILCNPDAKTLCRIAAALGLAQNLAALFALVTEGIQAGHMRLHNRRNQ